MSEEIPTQVEQVTQDGQGVHGAQVPPQGDRSLNVEGGNEVPEISLIAIAQPWLVK